MTNIIYEKTKLSVCCGRELVETPGGLMCLWCGAPDYSDLSLCGTAFPHDFQVEDQGEQVDVKCARCGRKPVKLFNGENIDP